MVSKTDTVDDFWLVTIHQKNFDSTKSICSLSIRSWDLNTFQIEEQVKNIVTNDFFEDAEYASKLRESFLEVTQSESIQILPTIIDVERYLMWYFETTSIILVDHWNDETLRGHLHQSNFWQSRGSYGGQIQ